MVGQEKSECYARNLPINKVLSDALEHQIDSLIIKGCSNVLTGSKIVKTLWTDETAETPPNYNLLCEVLDEYKKNWTQVHAFAVLKNNVTKIVLMFNKEPMKDDPCKYIKRLSCCDKVYMIYPRSEAAWGYKVYGENMRSYIEVFNWRETIYTNDIAAQILEEFDNVLSDKGIKVPSREDDEREDDNEAALYGSTYDHLLNHTERIIIETLKDAKVTNYISDMFSGIY